jgi:hypothetical protein
MRQGYEKPLTEGKDSASNGHRAVAILLPQESQGKANQEPHRPKDHGDNRAYEPTQSNSSFH